MKKQVESKYKKLKFLHNGINLSCYCMNFMIIFVFCVTLCVYICQMIIGENFSNKEAAVCKVKSHT